jgi:hypothetical protein
MFTAFVLIPNFRVSALLWAWVGVGAASLALLLILLRRERA